MVAMDIHRQRLSALKTAAAAQGLQHMVDPRNSDLRRYAEWVAAIDEEHEQEHKYDRLLLDGPCSGLGVLAKR